MNNFFTIIIDIVNLKKNQYTYLLICVRNRKKILLIENNISSRENAGKSSKFYHSANCSEKLINKGGFPHIEFGPQICVGKDKIQFFFQIYYQRPSWFPVTKS